MAIAFRSAASTSAMSAGSVTVTKPAGVASGDTLIAFVSTSTSAVTVITPPSGWTLVFWENSAVSFQTAIYWKTAGGSEPASYTWTYNGTSGLTGGTIAAYTGCDPSAPVLSYSSQYTASTSNIVALSVTPSVANTMVVGGFCVNQSAIFSFTADANMTDRNEEKVSCGQLLADEARAGTTATGTRTSTFTVGTGNVIGQLVVLQQPITVPTDALVAVFTSSCPPRPPPVRPRPDHQAYNDHTQTAILHLADQFDVLRFPPEQDVPRPRRLVPRPGIEGDQFAALELSDLTVPGTFLSPPDQRPAPVRIRRQPGEHTQYIIPAEPINLGGEVSLPRRLARRPAPQNEPILPLPPLLGIEAGMIATYGVQDPGPARRRPTVGMHTYAPRDSVLIEYLFTVWWAPPQTDQVRRVYRHVLRDSGTVQPSPSALTDDAATLGSWHVGPVPMPRRLRPTWVESLSQAVRAEDLDEPSTFVLWMPQPNPAPRVRRAPTPSPEYPVLGQDLGQAVLYVVWPQTQVPQRRPVGAARAPSTDLPALELNLAVSPYRLWLDPVVPRRLPVPVRPGGTLRPDLLLSLDVAVLLSWSVPSQTPTARALRPLRPDHPTAVQSDWLQVLSPDSLLTWAVPVQTPARQRHPLPAPSAVEVVSQDDARLLPFPSGWPGPGRPVIVRQGRTDEPPWRGLSVIISPGPYFAVAGDVYCPGVVAGTVSGGDR